MAIPIKVSVIVPVFNGEKYLVECIDSILAQSLSEIEIIIINDGSTDKTKEIIEDYCKRDNRIIFIDCQKVGVSACRNHGLKIAKGEFVGFVDADDYVNYRMYEELYKLAKQNNCSLSVCNVQNVEKDKLLPRLKLRDELIEMKETKEIIVLDFLKFKFDFSNWNKIYSLRIIHDNKIFFNEEMSIWEDILFNLIYLNYIDKIITLQDNYYYYRVHENSVMRKTKTGISKQYNLFYSSYTDFCEKHCLKKELEVFKENRAETCIANILRIINPKAIFINFLSINSKFIAELKELNPVIYRFNKNRTGSFSIKYFFLYHQAIKVFSLIYLTELSFKNSFRNLIIKLR